MAELFDMKELEERVILVAVSTSDEDDTEASLDELEELADTAGATAIGRLVQSFEGESIGVFIGPEGGFAEEEIALAQENGITPITLGKRILRTETAGMTTTAILLYELD